MTAKKTRTSIFIDGDGVGRICDGVETYYYTKNGYVFARDRQVCVGLRDAGITLTASSTYELLKTIRLHNRFARIQARACLDVERHRQQGGAS